MSLFNFNNQSDISNWNIVDDVVMGGRSNGTFSLSNEGKGVFKGKVSLENNGGFSMVQYNFDTKKVIGTTKVCIRLKGDGKSYSSELKLIIAITILMLRHFKPQAIGKPLKYLLTACIRHFVAEN